VLFDRPDNIEILIKVTTTNGSEPNIQQAVLDYANGLINGMAGFVVGADVSCFDIAAGIIAENPSYYLSNVQIAINTMSPVFANTPIAIGVKQIAVTQLSFVTVVIV
jgi:hypothetical protein